MRVAALYDVHGNLPALEAVLAEVEAAGADLVLVGGDVASGPMPGETLERVRALGERVHFIRGNADRELVSTFDRRELPAEGIWGERAVWAARRLTWEQRDFLAELPETAAVRVDGLGKTLFCHATPRSDEQIVPPSSSDVRLSMVFGGHEKVVVCGHTHMQFDRKAGHIRVVNAGSVGLPYEGEAGAYWALLGPGVELRRTVYDFERAAERIRATGFPDADELVHALFEKPPSREEVVAFFEKLSQQRSSS